ncbi:riboflavin synthase [Alkalimonas sp. MEB108]|uniref:Riboflavin synthase n=1 Tax=Alkalimonas cellulosilytica TaxID=3058395 RepID=A0ABU7J030_9GAMM|nr:riboflavin synthase [Alkalimonas sp. MEB108]MEE1999851.1 riboflavin synthase [Alkalimonas sp. MEB108]
MFTGIIEAVGRIRSSQKSGQGMRLWIESEQLDFSDVKLGDSIASNGVCLTVTAKSSDAFQADLSAETLRRTLFGSYQSGQRINLEKALLPSSRLGGHLVSGHVDGIGRIRAIEKKTDSWELWLAMPQELSRYIAEKGSITLDGISLTVNELSADAFRLTIVPHTALVTTLQQAKVGMTLHLEVDLIARYLERLLQPDAAAAPGVSTHLLRARGFI